MAPLWGRLQAGVRALTESVFKAEARIRRLAAGALRGRQV
jgi:hypothetical protein